MLRVRVTPGSPTPSDRGGAVHRRGAAGRAPRIGPSGRATAPSAQGIFWPGGAMREDIGGPVGAKVERRVRRGFARAEARWRIAVPRCTRVAGGSSCPDPGWTCADGAPWERDAAPDRSENRRALLRGRLRATGGAWESRLASPDVTPYLCRCLGRRQVVRQRFLVPPSGGSNPPAPTNRPARPANASTMPRTPARAAFRRVVGPRRATAG